MKSRTEERTFLEIPVNQQTKTHSSGQIQLSQSLKLNPPPFQSLCTVSTLYFSFFNFVFPFSSVWISLKSHQGSPQAGSLYFSHFLNLFDLLVRPRIKCHVYHGKRKPETELKESISSQNIFNIAVFFCFWPSCSNFLSESKIYKWIILVLAKVLNFMLSKRNEETRI